MMRVHWLTALLMLCGACAWPSSGFPARPLPQDPTRPSADDFDVYWAVGGEAAKFVNPPDLPVRRDLIVIYHFELGAVPTISPSGKVVHGAVPQAIDWRDHWDGFEEQLRAKVPDPNFAGYVVLDYEGWHPQWEVTGERFREISRDRGLAAISRRLARACGSDRQDGV